MLRVLAIAGTAVILIPGGAHLFELAAKIGLSQPDYFAVQQIYAGWALFAGPILLAIVLNAALGLTMWRQDRRGAVLALASAMLIVLSLSVFFVWVFPANQATANWTMVPGDWERLRRDWEFGHAASAVITFVAFLTLVIAAIRGRHPA